MLDNLEILRKIDLRKILNPSTYLSGRTVNAGVLNVRGFLASPINMSFTLCMRAQHRIVYSTSYGHVG